MASAPPDIPREPLQRRISGGFLRRGLRPFLIVFAVEIALIVIVTASPFFPGEQSLYDSQAKQLNNEFQGVGLLGLFTGIFLNNFRIALLMMVPGLGPLFFGVSLYSTARVLETIALTQGLPPLLVLVLLLLLFPHSWIELPAYAVATTGGVFLLISLIRWIGAGFHRFSEIVLPELGRLGIVIVIATVMLVVAAAFEAVEIELSSPGFLVTWLPFLGLIALTALLVRRFEQKRRSVQTHATVQTTQPQSFGPQYSAFDSTSRKRLRGTRAHSTNR